jgi:xanthine dehydrogenase accessory factor
MNITETLCLIRGGGDIATGAIYRLFQAGFPVIVMELSQPLVVRRTVSFAEAVYAGEVEVEGVHARRVPNTAEALRLAVIHEMIPVLIDEQGSAIKEIKPKVLVDARMAKVNMNTCIDDADFVVGLGPGFTAGGDCHALIETLRGFHLGRVIRDGKAAENTGKPEAVAGYAEQRVVRAPHSGRVKVRRDIGDLVEEGECLAEIGETAVYAPFKGIIRGMIHDGLVVPAGLKIGDIDPRQVRDYCFEISDKALAIGGGVLEAVLAWLNKCRIERRKV